MHLITFELMEQVQMLLHCIIIEASTVNSKFLLTFKPPFI